MQHYLRTKVSIANCSQMTLKEFPIESCAMGTADGAISIFLFFFMELNKYVLGRLGNWREKSNSVKFLARVGP